MVFRNQEGREQRIIRFRTYYPTYNEREEVLFVEEKLTTDLTNGKLLVGLTETDCEKIK